MWKNKEHLETAEAESPKQDKDDRPNDKKTRLDNTVSDTT